MHKQNMEPALQNLADNIVERVNLHTEKVVEKAIDELAGMTQREFTRLEKKIDGLDSKFDGLNSRMGRVEERLDGVDMKLDHIDDRLVRIDNHLGLAKYEFSES